MIIPITGLVVPSVQSFGNRQRRLHYLVLLWLAVRYTAAFILAAAIKTAKGPPR